MKGEFIMTLKEEYQQRLNEYEALKRTSHAHLWIDQVNRYVEPFQIFGSLYYVGDNNICMHLIDTGDGLLLCDAGNYGSEGLLVNAIWEAGFNPHDIRWIILSHAHVDHIGCAEFFRKMYGCKLYIGAPDARMMKDAPEQTLVQRSSDISHHLFEPDEVINDGDILTFGNTAIEFYLVPGHTKGTLAYFFPVSDGSRTLRAGYYGGFGFNTLTKAYLTETGDPDLQMRQTYLESLNKVRDQKVDIFLGNHTNNNRLLEKRKKMLEEPDVNPFIDSSEWRTYLDRKRDELLAFMADPSK